MVCPDAIIQILTNLLSNAIKFSASGSKIDVAVAAMESDKQGGSSMDGLEVLRLLQAKDVTRSIPVVLLADRVQPEDRAKFAQAGFAGVILKPFDPIALADK